MSRVGHDIRHGLVIARVELRRSIRKSFGTRKRQLTAVAFVVLFTPTLLFWARTAHSSGRSAAQQGALPLETLGVQVGLLAVVFVVMSALRVVQQGRPEGDDLLLTATSPRAVLFGTTAHLTVQLVGFISLPTLLFAGGFALGAGFPSLVVTAVLAAIPLFTAVSLTGTVLGQLVVLGLLHSQFLRSAGRAFGVVLLLALLGLSYAAMAPLVGATGSLEPLTAVASPVVLYLAFAFVGTPLGPELAAGSLLVGAGVVASIPALLAVADRLAPRLWFADATPSTLARRDESTTTAPADGSTGNPDRPFPPRLGPRPLGVALGLWTRWIRLPVRFSPLFPLVIVLATAVFGVLGEPEQVPLVVGGVLAFAGVYVSGATFGLNPLGEANEMRAIEYLSATDARTLVRGHVLAGLLVGTPIAVVGAVVAAGTLGLAPVVAVGLGLIAAVTTVASSGVAVGIGTLIPSHDTRRTYRGYEVATPSQWALIAYMVAALLVAAIAAIAGVLVLFAGDAGTQSAITVAAAAVTTVVLAGVGFAGYRAAIGRFSSPPYASGAERSGSRALLSAGGGEAEGASASSLESASFTRTQKVRGLVLLGAFVVLRAVAVRVWNRYFPGGYSTDPLFLAFLGGVFLFLSVGLVYLGFTRWVGVDLRAWWVERGRLRGDLAWGIVGTIAVLLATLGGGLAISAMLPGLGQVGTAGAAPAPAVSGSTGTDWVTTLLLGWFFGFAIAAFQEETLFRGFLQGLLRERYGRAVAVVGQAAVFALAHLTYYPVSAWPLVLVVLLVGLVTGWLVDRRGTLLAAGIAHGFVG
ncbi:type II CAAX prenyl endopeptidase Rce1 family protein [Halomicroarcula sp. GCM10025817]|uniref:CPBP family intramembrane glutamic endopeptidase n=1 Tax=Haloarcula TaxID=2237 RepID=UPI0023E87490|nr:CPBP family intramembrane glutamic endopeptidase [Halomicroarcula sp. SYNS111]